MSSIFGIINKRGESIDVDAFQNAMASLSYWNPDRSNTVFKGNIAFGQHMLITTKESQNEILPYFDVSSDLVITADARIDYREDLARKLGLDWEIAAHYPDSILILEAYKKWSSECTKHLYGDYSFAIYNFKDHSAYCARDHLGCRPFFYFNHSDFFVFSTELRGILGFPDTPCQIDEQWILDSILMVNPEKEKTSYLDIKRLAPAHSMVIDKQGIHCKAYWDLSLNKQLCELNELKAVKTLKSHLIAAVRERSRTINSIGVELSGGLDSSVVTVLAAIECQKIGTDIKAFSQILNDKHKDKYFPFYDELKYSEMVASHAKVKSHLLVDGVKSNGYYGALNKNIKILFENDIQKIALMMSPLYEECKLEQVRVLLTGFGGDEGVSSEPPGYFEELVVQGKFRKLRSEIQKRDEINGIRLLIKVFLYYWITRIPGLHRIGQILHLRNDWRSKKYNLIPLLKETKRSKTVRMRFFRNVKFPKDNDVRMRQYKMIMHNHIQQRLESSYITAQSYGLECRHPLLDIKLIEFYYSLPSHLKYKDGVGRHLLRQAVKDFLPSEIYNRRNKSGTTIPNAYYRFTKDLDLYIALIDENEKRNSTHYFDYEKLRNLAYELEVISLGKKKGRGLVVFLNSLTVLLLQKLQREKKIDIGINC